MRRMRSFVLLALVAAVCVGGIARAEYLPGWGYRQEITVDPALAGSNLTDFPLLVKVDNASNDLFSKVSSPAGQDIVFTAADGQTLLPREIEYYSGGGTPELNAWVKTDISSTAPTTLYMYYHGPTRANSTDTWDSDHVMVQHFQESSAAAGSRLDSTSNANDGSPLKGTTPTDLHSDLGRIDGADEFDNVNARIDVADSASLDSLTNGTVSKMTVEAWVRPDRLKVAELIMKDNFPSSSAPFEVFQSGAKYYCRLNGSSSTLLMTDGAFSPGVWSYVVATYDNTLSSENLKLFVNGDKEATAGHTITLGTNNDVLVMGAYADGQYPFDGLMDEVRISNVARTADWLAAVYDNVDNPGLISFGVAEVVPEPGTLLLVVLGLLGCFYSRPRRRAAR